jgi:hypothetical protein
MLARTDNEAYRAFSLRAKSKPDQPDRYGEQIWGDKYYRI